MRITSSVHLKLGLASAVTREVEVFNKRSRPRAAGTRIACVIAAVVLYVAPAWAQDPLVAARDLYRAAEYEGALARLNTLRASARAAGDTKFIEQYRALCLLALGRTTEAERAIEAVVTSSPTYRPTDTEESPRIRAAFSEVRQRVLPQIIQQQYTDARAAFDRGDSTVASAKFQQVLDLLADADVATVAGQPPLSEIRTLATEFRDLSAKTTAQKSAAAPAAAAPIVREAAPSPAPGSRGPAASAPGVGIYSMQDSDVVPPVVVRESWAALADVFAVRTGVVTVIINELGDVETVTMTVPVNPVYDRLAVATAKNWKYRPATVNGVPVKFRRVVLLDLKTTR
ncbi:MAG: energy transducer TonB [Vicinamibacterales bacterium]